MGQDSSIISKTVAFDLETIPDPAVISLLPPVEPNSNLKDPAKIAEDIRKKELARNKDLSLDPFWNMTVAFGWADTDGECGHILLTEASPEAVKGMLNAIWDRFAQYQHYVTFNGIAFDVRILAVHSMIARVGPGVKIDCRKYSTGNHTDLRMILGNWDQYAKGTLDFYLKRILGEGEGKLEGMDGSLVKDYWDVNPDSVGEYAESDAVQTLKLYRVVKNFIF